MAEQGWIMVDKFDLKNLETKILKIVRENPGITDQGLLSRICSSETEQRELCDALKKYGHAEKPLSATLETLFRLNCYVKMLESYGKLKTKIDPAPEKGPVISDYENMRITYHPT